ncbi:MAG: type I secretion system permease/ATPase [Azoarcus sp.]|jgi:ATP-binding cassette subfamily C protein LapB|nr:type I secretion system permease/ATPase [Azoarcus sp.]
MNEISVAEAVKQADSIRRRSSSVDALLNSLLILVRAFGGNQTRDAIVAGLPLKDGKLTPALFERAARRAGMRSNIVAASLDNLNPALLPAVLLLNDGSACVVTQMSTHRNRWRVIFPELSDAAVMLDRAELERHYSGNAIYVRPEFQFDARAQQSNKVARNGHWFWSVIAANKRIYNDVLLAAFIINLFAVAMPLFVMNVYDRVVPNSALDTLWVLTIGVFIVLLFDMILRTMRGYFVDLAGSRIDVELSAHIMERVLGMRMEARPASAGSLAANMKAFESVRDFISSATVTAFIDLPFALLFMLVIVWIAWPLVLPFVLGIVVLVIYSLAVQSKMHDLAQASYRAGAQRNATLVEGLVGVETLKTMSAEATVQHKWETSTALLARVSTQLRLLSASATNGANWIIQLVSLAVILIGVYLISEHELSVGGLVACYMLSSRAMSPIGRIAGLLVQYHTAATSLESTDSLMNRECERPGGANFISRKNLSGEIEFRDVVFNYPAQEIAALNGVSFRIKAGERVAIIGRVGSGKTTLEKLILGLYRPLSGAVMVDGIDVRQLDPAELRRHIGYVPQDPVLFYGSLRENIALPKPHADDAEVLRAAAVAGMTGFVNAHPQGFDMVVSERGDSLSGGQRKSVAIARAVIHDPPILLLDEPTASMDHTTEEEIKRNLKEFSQGKTMLLITHRTPLLELVDRIIVIDAGRLVADGPKEQVVEALRQGKIGRSR